MKNKDCNDKLPGISFMACCENIKERLNIDIESNKYLVKHHLDKFKKKHNIK